MMKRWRRFRQPVNVAPQVAFLFAEMERQRIGIMDMSRRSGVQANAIMRWRLYHDPRLSNIEACYNVLGLTLEGNPRKEPG